jgi:hypothetical protein
VSDVSLWSLYAFMDGDEDGANDERRMLAEWQVPDVARWALARGYDNIYLARVPEKTRFEKAPHTGVKHSGGKGWPTQT